MPPPMAQAQGMFVRPLWLSRAVRMWQGVVAVVLLAGAVVAETRDERRQRVLSLLQTHDTTPAPLSRVSYHFTPSYSGGAGGGEEAVHLPPILNTWVTWDTTWGSAQPSPPPTTTAAPTPSPYDLWYYRDDSDNVQGPYASFTMMEWFKAGYFRSSPAPPTSSGAPSC